MYVSVIVDISHKAVDREFTYRVPFSLERDVNLGSVVWIPFGQGNQKRRGYVTGIRKNVDFPEEKIKEIIDVDRSSVQVTDALIRLAIWMRNRYGGTLYQCLVTVVQNKTKIQAQKKRRIQSLMSSEELEALYGEALRKKHYRKMELLAAFRKDRSLPGEVVSEQLCVPSSTLKKLEEEKRIEICYEEKSLKEEQGDLNSVESQWENTLNEEQFAAKQGILKEKRTVSLLHGITGSGKTEVYLALIEEMLKQGKDTIVLIPEIALTYQTVIRFYQRFGEQVSVVHSRISKGTRYERFEKAKNGEVHVMIGPRSALFTPFPNLGLIIIDEFHEKSYISEQVPKYNAIDTAIQRGIYENAKVVLGSATPSVEFYERALQQEFGLFALTKRAVAGAALPEITIVDMAEELEKGNRSIFSDTLREKIQERLDKKEQVMLFLNRRGYSGSISCRKCGKPVECPHCSVPMNMHFDQRLYCHFCGYSIPSMKICPSCHSAALAGFGIGTEKVEERIQRIFPKARVLRMDADTTKGKDGHKKLLEQFVNREADILIGTQMIIKGHDFPNVTLMGVIAADLSLNVPDFRSGERTYQMLVQAAGRAGRGEKKGDCVIQTYSPRNYCVQAAANQDYQSFFENEMVFRKQMKYPPVGYFMGMFLSGNIEAEVQETMEKISRVMQEEEPEDVRFLGPSEAGIYKLKDMYRFCLYFKSKNLNSILMVKNRLEKISESLIGNRNLYVYFENA